MIQFITIAQLSCDGCGWEFLDSHQLSRDTRSAARAAGWAVNQNKLVLGDGEDYCAECRGSN